MNTLSIILLTTAGVIASILIIGLFMRRNHYVRREIIIDAPTDNVFNYIKLLKNQDNFNKHAMAGSDRKREYKGTDGTVGFIYAWSGDKQAGEGEKEIKSIVEGKKIEAEIRFVKPMAATASIIMETESLSDYRTKVYWSNSGKFNYPMNILIPVMEKMLPKEMDESLVNLKNILEKQN
jgi:hypothetical protein